MALLCPSQWYEGMPRVVIESLAVGTPVIASHIGCYPEMIVDGVTGALFPLAMQSPCAFAFASSCVHGDSLQTMRTNARRLFEVQLYGREESLTLAQYLPICFDLPER